MSLQLLPEYHISLYYGDDVLYPPRLPKLVSQYLRCVRFLFVCKFHPTTNALFSMLQSVFYIQHS